MDTFIRVARNGSTIGKLRIAMREKLLLARDAIADTIVSVDASPRLPRIRAIRKRGTLTTRFPISKRKRPKEKPERIVIRRRLYITFDNNTPCGLAMV